MASVFLNGGLLIYITSGSVKNRNIATLPEKRLVEALVRKALYSVIGSEVEGKVVLDLFGGCGTMGLEALSWGAAHCIFCDVDRRSVDIIKKNAQKCCFSDKTDVFNDDFESFIVDFARMGKKTDIVFIDPPYNKGLLTKSLKALNGYDIVDHSGYLILLGSEKEDADCTGYACVFERRYGDRRVRILIKDESNISRDI